MLTHYNVKETALRFRFVWTRYEAVFQANEASDVIDHVLWQTNQAPIQCFNGRGFPFWYKLRSLCVERHITNLKSPKESLKTITISLWPLFVAMDFLLWFSNACGRSITIFIKSLEKMYCSFHKNIEKCNCFQTLIIRNLEQQISILKRFPWRLE